MTARTKRALPTILAQESSARGEGDLVRAEELLARATNLPAFDWFEVDRDLGYALVDLGSLRMKLGRHLAAEKAYRRALAVAGSRDGPRPKFARNRIALSLHGLVEALLLLGRTHEAEPIFRRLVGLWPEVWGADEQEFDEARYAFAQVLIVNGKREEADKWWKPEVEPPGVDPPDPSRGWEPVLRQRRNLQG